ncbi:MAG: peptidylprolyl isomerase, partial [Opitutus sp.]
MHVRPTVVISSSFRWMLAAALLFTAGCRRSDAGKASAPVPASRKSSGGLHATIETDKGTIEIELLAKDAPKTVENFRLLAERGYYNGITFHRIVRGFMIQGGDPQGTGEGGESAWGGKFEDEIDRKSDLYRGGYRRGMLAMANAGPDTNGSQFFIMHQDYPLQPNYTIFGQVTNGMDVVDTLAVTETAMGMD